MTCSSIFSAVISTLLLVAEAQAAPTRHLLAIGNDTYPGRPLQNARNDARAIAEMFGSMGYSVVLQLDLKLKAMEDSVATFSKILTPGDVAILYYSGHGLQLNGENYLIPTDFNVTSSREVPLKAVSLSSIVGIFAAQGATTQIVILDACRDNPFLPTRSVGGGWAENVGGRGTFLAFGTSPGSTASDNPSDVHGLFTQALLKHLSSHIDIDAVFNLVRREVVQDSSGLQIPWTASSLTAKFQLSPTTDMAVSDLPLRPALVAPRPMDMTSSYRSMPSGGVTGRDDGLGTERKVPDDESARILVQQGLLLAKQKNYTEAIKSVSAALSLNPGSGLALRILGLLLHLVGRSADSIQVLDRAITAEPTQFLPYYYRCLAANSEEPTASVRDCQAAIGISPDYAPAHLGLANALLNLGQLPAAHSEADKAIGLAPDLPLAYAVRGRILNALGNYAGAQRDYRSSVKLSVRMNQKGIGRD
jgi:Caspase domain/Tetratricopeptide repeat